MKAQVCFFLLAAIGVFPGFADELNLKTIQAQVAQGDPLAEYELGRAYHLGQGVPQDFVKAAALYRQAAAQGNAKSMYNLGYIFQKGQGVAQDYPTAAQWFQKSAEQGLAAAQLELGLFYYEAPAGIKQDYVAAAKWLTMAAQQDNAPAEYNLGFLYQHGQGVAKDAPKAAEWFRKAAGHGLAAAQLQLGLLYYFGDTGIKQDYVEAAKWLTMASQPTNAPTEIGPAANALGAMNENGFGMPKNEKEALIWYTKAAEMGNSRAQWNLGRLKLEGDFSKRDLVEGYMWLKLASDQRDPMAMHLLADYVKGKTLTPEQIAEGDRKVKLYKAMHSRTAIATQPGQILREH